MIGKYGLLTKSILGEYKLLYMSPIFLLDAHPQRNLEFVTAGGCRLPYYACRITLGPPLTIPGIFQLPA